MNKNKPAPPPAAASEPPRRRRRSNPDEHDTSPDNVVPLTPRRGTATRPPRERRRYDDPTAWLVFASDNFNEMLLKDPDWRGGVGLISTDDGLTYMQHGGDHFDPEELAAELRAVVLAWIESMKGEPAARQFAKANLRPQTLSVLKREFTEWRQFIRGHVPKPDEIADSEKDALSGHLRLPYWVMDNFMNRLTPSEWKVFCYVARRATGDPDNPNFGRCWLSYKDISADTGVVDIQRCVQKLKSRDVDLISVEHKRTKTEGSNSWGTLTNQFTVRYLFEQRNKLGKNLMWGGGKRKRRQ